MKKIALLFAALLLVSLVGCSHDSLMEPKGSADGPTGITFDKSNTPDSPADYDDEGDDEDEDED